ncbi:hypothetical protein BDN70DRAFT_817966, partial [Pholiota conissans]
ADTTFVSSDNVLFEIHGSYLTLSTSIGFAKPSGDTMSRDLIHLPESSQVLEALFQFIEPPSDSRNYRQPSVADLSSNLFFEVAEAAEKYIVYAAMNVCITTMRYVLKSDSPEVLNHCYKHGYTNLIDQAASNMLSRSLTEAAIKLTAPGLLQRWTFYYGQWHDAIQDAISKLEKNMPRDCHVWSRVLASYARKFEKDPTLYFMVKPSIPTDVSPRICSSYGCSCKELPDKWPAWFEEICDSALVKFRSMAKFSDVTIG